MPEWTLTVWELNEYVRKKLAGDPMLRSIKVKGEISGFKRHVSGHLYFTLKDSEARVSCAMFRSQAMFLDFQPRDGQQVVVTAAAGLYTVSGTYQLYVEDMKEDGTGTLYEKFEKLKKRLADEGLFDPAVKKPLPVLPKTIGVVTSRAGAAFHDIIRVSRERDPKVNILIAPCAVQGAGAAEEIAEAIDRLNREGSSEVILVGRGGGSMEDLWAFNEEIVARAIFASRIPVVSCVGHEIDFTISDFVSDVRAATPSNAAEIAVWNYYDEKATLGYHGHRIRRALKNDLGQKRTRLDAIGKNAYLSMPVRMLIDEKRKALLEKKNLFDQRMDSMLKIKRARLEKNCAYLRAVNPDNVLKRGYSVVYRNGKVITDACSLSKGEEIRIALSTGSVSATVNDIEGKET